MINTLGELSAALERLRAEHGGATRVGIDDADTHWTLAIESVEFDAHERRVLIGADEYKNVLSGPYADPVDNSDVTR